MRSVKKKNQVDFVRLYLKNLMVGGGGGLNGTLQNIQNTLPYNYASTNVAFLHKIL